MTWRDWFRPAEVKTVLASPYFDAKWYLDRYPDVRASGIHPARHYAQHGVADLRDPGPMLSTSGYQTLHDTQANPLQHIAENGTDPQVTFAGETPQASRRLLLVGHQSEAKVFGAERSFLTMLEQAASTGAEIHAMLPAIRNQDYLTEILKRVHKLHVVPYGFRTKTPPNRATVKAIKDRIKQIDPEAVHQNTLAVDAALTAAAELGLHRVMHVRELPEEDPDLCTALNATPAQLRSKAQIEADLLVANSQAVADWLDSKTAIISPNIVAQELFEIDTLPHVPLRVGLIGNLINKKGIGDLMMVAQAVQDAGARAEFRLIGPSTRELEALKPWPENVQHLGYLNSPREAMEAVDIVLSLSHFAESFGRTVLEAMAAGRPVICYKRGTPPSLLGRDLAGYVCPADSPKAVAEALMPMLKDRAEYTKVSKRMRKRAVELQKQNRATDLSQIFGT